MSEKEDLDRLPRNLKILALHRKKVTRAEHEKKKDLVKSWISEQNFKDRFVKNPKTSKNDQHCSNQVKRKELVNEKNGKRILAEVTNRKELSDYRGQKFLDDLIENKFDYM